MVFQQFTARAVQLNNGPLEGDIERLVHTLTHYGQGNLAAWLAAHLLNRVVQGIALHRHTVQADNKVTALNTGPVSRRPINRRDDTNYPVFQGHFNPETPKFTPRININLVERLWIEIARVRVEPTQHSPHGITE